MAPSPPSTRAPPRPRLTLCTTAVRDPCGGREHRQILPQAGWVEHDPVELSAIFGAVRVAGRSGARPRQSGRNRRRLGRGERSDPWTTPSFGRTPGPARSWNASTPARRRSRWNARGCLSIPIFRPASFAGSSITPKREASRAREANGLARATPFSSTALRCLRHRRSTASRTSLMNLKTRQWDPDSAACSASR